MKDAREAADVAAASATAAAKSAQVLSLRHRHAGTGTGTGTGTDTGTDTRTMSKGVLSREREVESLQASDDGAVVPSLHLPFRFFEKNRAWKFSSLSIVFINYYIYLLFLSIY